MSDILSLSTRGILEGFKSKALSPVDYMNALIKRVEEREPEVAALWLFRPEHALSEAKAAEARWMADTPQGALDGVPVTIKEILATEGDPIPLGTAATDPVPAKAHSPVAARLAEAGAIMFAKTTCPDYGMLSSGLSSFHKLSRNPWDLSQNPGGSSAGAGSAGAAGYGPLHVGTDIGGSVRLPAGWTGLFGFKPTLGRVPIDPYYTGRCAGPMTPTVDDSAYLMAEMSRPDWRDATALAYEPLDWFQPAADVSGMKIGLMLDAGAGTPADPEVQEAVTAAAKLFEKHGAAIVPIQPVLTRQMLDGLDVAWRARFWGMMEQLPDEKKALILPYILEWAQGIKGTPAPDVARGFDQTFEIRAACARALHGVDAILSPVNPDVSYPAEHASPSNDPRRPFEHIGFTMPWNMGEQPACSIHCGLSKSGIPIGLQIVAPRFEDLRVFALARAYEAWRGPIPAWPMDT